MTNVSRNSDKVRLRKRLFQIGVQTLQKEGWTVERIPRRGKSSLRRITKGGEIREVSIRTTQDTYIAFPRNKKDTAWVTLSDVDSVLAVSIDDRVSPKFALVHMIDGDEMRDRFDRTYAARRAADHKIPVGRGVWLSLYLPDAASPPVQVGAGAGRDNPPIARVPLQPEELRALKKSAEVADVDELDDTSHLGPEEANDENEPLTIGEAKRRLALFLGVDSSNIKITVEA